MCRIIGSCFTILGSIMSGVSSSVAAWSTRLDLPRPRDFPFRREDDPRLGEITESWHGSTAALTPGRAVLLGFPQDEGVRRNHGRPGAAKAPHEIRTHLFRLTPYDAERGINLTARPPLDAGDLRLVGSLEETQDSLAVVIAGLLEHGTVPVVLGGGHETAYGVYLGYVEAQKDVGIINIDAHLDVRPYVPGHGHSGSPFRQALELPTRPLPGPRYVCLGAQPQAASREHVKYAQERGCI